MKKSKSGAGDINMKMFALLMLMSAFLPLEATARANASYKETMTWLRAKVLESSVTQTQSNPSNGVKLEFIASYRDFSWSGCSITVGQDVLVLRSIPGHNDDSAKSSSTITFSLADMSPNVTEGRVHVPAAPNGTGWMGSGYTVSLSVTTGALKVRGVDANGQTKSSAVFSFDTQSREVARRMANAFSSAIKQCGGKVEPF